MSRSAASRGHRRVAMGELIAGQTTAMVITYNEGPNLRRCLDRLRWAPRILLVDSGSTDETLDIARQHPQVDIVERTSTTLQPSAISALPGSRPAGCCRSTPTTSRASLRREISAMREDDVAGSLRPSSTACTAAHCAGQYTRRVSCSTARMVRPTATRAMPIVSGSQGALPACAARSS